MDPVLSPEAGEPPALTTTSATGSPSNVETMSIEPIAASGGVPAYLNDNYYWSYLNPRNVNLLDREWIVKAILWWQHSTLRAAVFDEIRPHHRVFQTAAVYGNFSRALARHLGQKGVLNVIDVAPVQVAVTRRKLADYPNSRVHIADATQCVLPHNTDIVVSYFLLHEVPDSIKRNILDNLLAQLPPNGKLLIVDYHKPKRWHPLKPLMSLIFDTLEPFAKAVWQNELSSFATDASSFDWRKTTHFGELYQSLIVTRKP